MRRRHGTAAKGEHTARNAGQQASPPAATGGDLGGQGEAAAVHQLQEPRPAQGVEEAQAVLQVPRLHVRQVHQDGGHAQELRRADGQAQGPAGGRAAREAAATQPVKLQGRAVYTVQPGIATAAVHRDRGIAVPRPRHRGRRQRHPRRRRHRRRGRRWITDEHHQGVAFANVLGLRRHVVPGPGRRQHDCVERQGRGEQRAHRRWRRWRRLGTMHRHRRR